MAEEPLTIKGALDLPPEEALRAFRARDELGVSVSYRDFEPEEHARAFTAAKIVKLDLLATLGESLNTALAEGQTFEQWKAGIEPELKRAGWWGLVTDPELTGTDKPVFVGDRRLRTIFGTNMRVSRAAGQWQRIQGVKDSRPFLRYSAVLDRRTRPTHAAWHAIILPVDHPFWQTHFPPNGWGCRCSVTQWSARDMERRGWSVTPESEIAVKVSLDPVGSDFFGGKLRARLPGIDPGWDYNPGRETLFGMAESGARSIQAARKAGLAEVAAQLLGELLASLGDEAAALLLRLLGSAGATAAAIQLRANLVAAARKARGKGGGGGRSMTRVKLSDIAKGRKRDAGGRFANEENPRASDRPEGWSPPSEIEISGFEATVRANSFDNTSRLTLGFVDRPDIPLGMHGRRIAFKADNFRHLLNRHGVGSPDPIPVEASDFARLARLVNGPSSVIVGKPSFRGNQTLRVVGTVDGWRYQLVAEAIGNRRFTGLAPLTLFKRPVR